MIRKLILGAVTAAAVGFGGQAPGCGSKRFATVARGGDLIGEPRPRGRG